MKFLITAGPTREPIDPVRYLSNRSSGKMGYAIARAALEAHHEVILISGPVCLPAPPHAELVPVVTSDDLLHAVQQRVEAVDCLVMCAAVADFKPAAYRPQKIKKRDGLAQLALVPTCDVLRSLRITRDDLIVIAFAAETEALLENAQKKLHEKNCALIVGNDVSRMDTGFESDENELVLLFRNGEIQRWPRASKITLARRLLKIFEQLAKNR